MGWRGDQRIAGTSVAPFRAYSGDLAKVRWKDAAQRLRASTSRRQMLLALAWLVPLALAGAFLVLFIAHLPRNITELAWDSDYASAFTMPETLVHTGTGGNTVMASSGQWVPLWFGLLTARLPLHRQLWGVAPTLSFLLTSFAVSWSVAQVAGRRAAVLAFLLSVVASSLALAFLMAPFAHNTVFPCSALLGVYLIWLARGQGRHLLVALIVPPLAGLALGACLASDLLVAPAALVPLGFTAILTGMRRERRSRILALSALVTTAVAIPVAKLTSAIMYSLGYRTLATPFSLAPLSELIPRAKLLFKGLKVLFNGYLSSPERPGTLHPELGAACTVVMSLALAALVLMGVRAVFKLLAGALHRQAPAGSPDELLRPLHIVYWASVAAGACGAFWLAAEGPEVLHESYYGSVIFAVAALVPLLLSKRYLLRLLVPGAVAIFFAGSLVGLVNNYMNEWAMPDISYVAQIAKAYHVRTGYSGYAQASSLTWNSDGSTIIRPVMVCSNPNGADACPFLLARVPAWYVPHRQRSFLLVNTNEGWLSGVPEGLGQPLVGYSFGPYRMFVYPYDIATRLGPLQ
jgi:hypothetical protein